MNKYQQGWAAIHAQAAVARREAWRTLISVFIVLGLFGAGVAVVLLLLGGCATTVAVKGSLVELKQPITLSGLVQVAQMGTECVTDSEEKEVERIIRETMTANGAFAPDSVKTRLLAGSSLCGPAQGVVDPIGTPDFGAYSMARAEVSLYWKGGITESDLRRAEKAFGLLRATPISAAAPKAARSSAK